MKKLLLALCLAVFLFGCGGGGDDGPREYTIEGDFADFDLTWCDEGDPYSIGDPDLNELLDASESRYLAYKCTVMSSYYLNSYGSTLSSKGFTNQPIDPPGTHFYTKPDGSLVLTWLAMKDGVDVYVGWLVVNPALLPD
jgi:hypothetical protein